jgi:uncharacterized protein YkwD
MNTDLLISLHNIERIKPIVWKLQELQKHTLLCEYAQNWAETMAANEALVHSKMKHIIELGFISVAENIAAGQLSEKEVMNSWLKSYLHKKNIMNKYVTHIGCGFYLSRHNKPYWCVCFGQERKN